MCVSFRENVTLRRYVAIKQQLIQTWAGSREERGPLCRCSERNYLLSLKTVFSRHLTLQSAKCHEVPQAVHLIGITQKGSVHHTFVLMVLRCSVSPVRLHHNPPACASVCQGGLLALLRTSSLPEGSQSANTMQDSWGTALQ